MAFGAVQIYPNDTRARVGIGVNIPFNEGGVFTPNYTTKEAIKNNLINYFLTNPGERPGNPTYGGGLRNFIFTNIDSENLDFLKDDINEKLKTQFPNILVYEVNVIGNFDHNEVQVSIKYSVQNTSITDDLTLSFE
jgi:phage baseplate assembly protein W|tara:strand:+ start:5057 stop:5464 length:408 start_codon:yes stop_codon:yes gene_type:complete